VYSHGQGAILNTQDAYASSQSFKSINSKKDTDSNQNKKHAPRMLGLNESSLFSVFIPLRALRLSERKNI